MFDQRAWGNHRFIVVCFWCSYNTYMPATVRWESVPLTNDKPCVTSMTHRGDKYLNLNGYGHCNYKALLYVLGVYAFSRVPATGLLNCCIQWGRLRCSITRTFVLLGWCALLSTDLYLFSLDNHISGLLGCKITGLFTSPRFSMK